MKFFWSLFLILLFVTPALAVSDVSVSHKGQTYRLPLKGWTFQQLTPAGYRPVTDMDMAVDLAQARDAFSQYLNPDTFQHAELARVMHKTMNAARGKQALNSFDLALTNVAGSYIGSALRMAAGDLTGGASFAGSLANLATDITQPVDLLTGAVATSIAAGSAMSTSEALGVGLVFGRSAELSAQKAADFQDHYFRNGSQTGTIPLEALQTAAGEAHQALRLSYPSAVLMTKVTERSGMETLESFGRNTLYGMAPGGFGDAASIIDSTISAAKEGVESLQALKAFDQAINHGPVNPLKDDTAIYREVLAKQGGLQERLLLEDMLAGGVPKAENTGTPTSVAPLAAGPGDLLSALGGTRPAVPANSGAEPATHAPSSENEIEQALAGNALVQAPLPSPSPRPTSPTPRPPALISGQVKNPPIPQQERQRQTEVVLLAGTEVVLKKRLGKPGLGNALERYRGVLRTDPGNTAALQGLDKLIDAYEQKAAKEFNGGDKFKALGYCRPIRDAVLIRLQTSDFDSEQAFKSWMRNFRRVDDCIDNDVVYEYVSLGRYNEAMTEIDEIEAFFENLLLTPLGSVLAKDNSISHDEARAHMSNKTNEWRTEVANTERTGKR